MVNKADKNVARLRRHRLTDIGHVAANHSVWDLEPEYLSA